MEKPNNKLQLRAQILKLLKEAKQDITKNILDLQKSLDLFNDIKDTKTLIKIVIKEFKGDGSEYDYLLSLIMTKVAPKDAESLIFEAIMSDSISDNKKIYLINILKDINKDSDYNALVQSIKDPDEIINKETENFAKESIFSINHQIDFLDFFYASEYEDKIELINNLIETSCKDEVAHILSLIIYSNENKNITDFIIEKLGNTHSYLSFYPLQYIIKNSKNKDSIKLSKNALNKLKISGLRDEIKKEKAYKKILQTSHPLSAWVTDVDGAGNFVVMFARERNDFCISFFSSIINLKYGVIECFGFEDLERFEFREISKKIFNEDKVYQITTKDALNLLNEGEKLSLNENYIPPYEYFAWRTLTYDIELDEDFKIEDELSKIKIDKGAFETIKNSSFFKNWFLKINDLKPFETLISKINKEENIDKINELINENINNIFGDLFDNQLTCQAFILKLQKKDNLSSTLYSIKFDENIKKDIMKYILKKSVLFYYCEHKDNIFAKNINKKVAEIIKEQWEKEF